VKRRIAAPKDLLAKDAGCKLDSLRAIGSLFLTNQGAGQADSPLVKTNKLAVAKLRLGDLEKIDARESKFKARLKMEMCALAMH